MFGFDGSHDSKKKVSMGGKGKNKITESKQQFLDRTTKEREDREVQRKRERAALKVQSFVRGRTDIAKRRDVERLGWDTAFENFVKSWAGEPPNTKLMKSDLAALMRRLLFFFRHNDASDNARLTDLSLWLVTGKGKSLTGPVGSSLLMQSVAEQGEEGVTAFLRMKRTCVICLERLARTSGQPPSDTQAIDAALQLHLSDGNAWAVYGVGNIQTHLVAVMVQEGLMQIVGTFFESDDSAASSGSRAQLEVLLCAVVARALGKGGHPVDEAYTQFVVNLLTKNMLLRRLNLQARQMLEFRGMWELLVTSLTNDGNVLTIQVCSGNPRDVIRFLGNIVDLSSSNLSSSSPAVMGKFATCTSYILTKVREQQQLLVADDDDMQIDDDDVVEKKIMQLQVQTAASMATAQHVVAKITTDPASRSRLPQTLTTVKHHIQVICNHDYIQRLLDVVLKMSASSSAEMEIDEKAKSPSSLSQEFLVVSGTCGLLLQLLEFVPEAKSDVLNALAFKPEVLLMLWEWIRSSVPSVAIAKGRVAEGALEHVYGILTMFCVIYNYLLMTVDNSEFYEGQYPFALEQVRNIVQVINNVVYLLYWSSSPLPAQAKRFRSLGSQLLNKLFERNCHREFMFKNSWLAPDRYVNMVVSELDSLVASRMMDPNEEVQSVLDEKHSLVLQSIPFSLPFELRVRIMRQLIFYDKQKLMDFPGEWIRCTVKRDNLVPDSYFELNPKGSTLKHTVRITFVSSDGIVEAGIDGGGLFKEFLNTLSQQAFNPQYGLFCQTPDKLLFPNPQAESASSWQASVDYLKLLEFLGRMVGKAIYDGILIELRLAPFFLRKMLGKEMYFDDISSLDPDLYKNLLFVKNYKGDFEDLGLNFVVAEDTFGKVTSTPLVPGGEDLAVTADNVLRYKNLVSDYWLNRRIKGHSQMFMRGLSDIVKPEWLRMFSPEELQMIISGSVKPIDVLDLRANTVYGGGYTDEHPSVLAFWNVVMGLANEELELLLMFVTSCSRPPLLGFKDLHPSFCIQMTSHTQEEANQRFPTASTCMNLLKLPCYTNETDLKDRLLYAIKSGAGFDLS